MEGKWSGVVEWKWSGGELEVEWSGEVSEEVREVSEDLDLPSSSTPPDE